MAGVTPGAPAQTAYPRREVPAAPSTGGTAPSQYSPPQSVGSNSVSPSSTSPTSPLQPQVHAPAPRSAVSLQNRPVQIGRPKPSSFVPAALRPTERPRPGVEGKAHGHRLSQTRNGPPTPPQSLHGSTDSLAGPGTNNHHARTTSTSPANSSLSKGAANVTANVRPSPIDTDTGNLFPRASNLLNSPTASLSSLSLTGLAAASAVTSAAPHPTKAHWKPDAMAPSCDAAACPISFTTFVRRHHCRRCGGVFCHRHASRQVLLDTDARMVATPALSSADSSSVPGTPKAGVSFGNVAWTQDGTTTPENGDDGIQMRTDVGLWRACDGCHAEWLNWTEGLREAAEAAMANNDSFGSRMQFPDGLAVPVGPDRKASTTGSVAGSVPSNWNWSTF